MVATLMGGGAPFDSCYHFHGSPIMAGIFALIGTVVSGITNSNTIKPALGHEE